MASSEKPSDIIQKARKQLTEALLQIEPELILDVADNHLLLTPRESFSLNEIKDPQKTVEKLIDTILAKGDATHERFLDCLENLKHAFPKLRSISEYLDVGPFDLRNEPQNQSTTPFLRKERGTGDMNAALSPGIDVKNLAPVSSDAGREVENPDPAMVHPGIGNRAEDPKSPLSSRKGTAVVELNDARTAEKRKGTTITGTSETKGTESGVNLDPSVSLEEKTEVGNPKTIMWTGSTAEILEAPKGKERGANNLEAKGQNLDATIPYIFTLKGKESETLDPSVCTEARSEVEIRDSTLPTRKESRIKSLDAPVGENGDEKPGSTAKCLETEDRIEVSWPLQVGSRAENPITPPSPRKESGTKKLNSAGSPGKITLVSKGKRKGDKNADDCEKQNRSRSPVRRERANDSFSDKRDSGEPSSLRDTRDLAEIQGVRTIPGVTSAWKTSHSEETKEDPETGTSSGTATQRLLGSVMSAGDIICKQRKQLIEILEKDLELVLDELLSQTVITEEEYEDLDKAEEDSKKKSRKLLIMIQKKGEIACFQFLERLEMASPGSRQVLQYSTHEEKKESPDALEEAKEDVSKGFSNQEQEDETQQEPKQEKKHPTKERSEALEDILSKLKLLEQRSKKFSLQDVLEISPESLKKWTPHASEDLPWHFLKNVLTLNVTARSTSLEQDTRDDKELRGKEDETLIDDTIFFSPERSLKVSVNPLDLLCAVLLCSDSFLQQEIFSKMSLCQFALPLLLPPLETPKCTLMLWAMRDIVKKWSPHSMAESKRFKEESLALISMPTISFVRMGSSNLSKSKLLNEFFSPSQQHYDFFIHRDMECGNIPREIADGLVEVAWYFPGGQEKSDLFPEPIAVANLRGDVESHWVQFSFLTQVSSAVFIFAEHIGEQEYALLSSLKESPTQYYFILECPSRKCNETLAFLNKLAAVLKLNKSHILPKAATTNKAEFVGKLRSTVGSIINSSPKGMIIAEMADVARELSIQVDEDCQECQSALRCAERITQKIKDVVNYKKETLKLQGDLWKDLAKVEKELCRMERQGDTPSEKYRSEQIGKLLKLRKQQNECDLTIGLTNFINGIKHFNSAEKHYFLKWMKFNLDRISRENLAKLRAEYKEKCKVSGDSGETITKIDQQISCSSLGVEHFIRELGQFYEAEYLMVKEGKIAQNNRQFLHFPCIAANLMLEGFPLELIDGDASNIPLQWITDVLSKLNNRLEGRSKMMVITVLGVQSTGKSTLLNTMFGLQFAVSSGRCTRGAFMTLLKVRENLTEGLGCDFVLVIDTEGLKAPELAKLEDTDQHDNELATLVIGLSDITIVNMSMENATEMKDILQIVTHAFLRMNKIGQKPNCQFVHQNVSDVSAHEQNMRDRKHLLEQFNVMTQAAAKMEKLDRDIKFSDIMDYDLEMHNWYIPGLWQGVPPMAPVNRGYSEKVFELKKYLFEFIRQRSIKRPPKGIPDFIEWVKSLWNAVKHENFIFSFRNSLIAEAYNHLSMKYSEWDWSFRREMHLWVSEQEAAIQNVSPEELDLCSLKNELQQKLLDGEKTVLESLKHYFESGAANLHLVEKYREDFVRSANSLKKDLEIYSYTKCKEAINIKKGQHKIDTLQAEYLKIIESKVDKLLEKCQKNEHRLGDQELKRGFERMWRETLSEISLHHVERREIYVEVESHLRKDLSRRGRSVNIKVGERKKLKSYRINNFQVKDEYIHPSVWERVVHMFTKREYVHKAEELAKSLMAKCMFYIGQKVNSKGDYDETYCVELLHMINEALQEGDAAYLHTTACFEVDLKLHILGEAAHMFQMRHEEFIKENDPQVRLEKLKPQFFSTFRDLYLKKDAQQNRAKDFCVQCLHPALVDYVNKRLGIEIVDNILNSAQSITYASRSFFQFTIQKELLEDLNFDKYVKYIATYEVFVKSWIWRQILDQYTKSEDLKNLEKEIISVVLKKIRETLQSMKHKVVQTIPELLDNFCRKMQKELVISKDSLVGIQFKNASNPGQFSVYVENFLPHLHEQILSEFDALDLEYKLSRLSVKPQDEIFKRMFGCGKQCPFCKVPCEAGGSAHQEHFAAVHRPEGLGRFRWEETQKLMYDLCSSHVASNCVFKNDDTKWQWHPYKDYRAYYPEWCIQPDPSINASDYWKYIFTKFNHDFAREYNANPADLPEDWENITEGKALESLKETYNMK